MSIEKLNYSSTNWPRILAVHNRVINPIDGAAAARKPGELTDLVVLSA
jgi:hypothetical protein